MKFLFTAIFLSIFLMSCDPGLINNYVVENKSEFLVIVEFKLAKGHRNAKRIDTIQTIQIRPGETVEIVDYCEIGTAYDKETRFLEAFEILNANLSGVDLSEKFSQRSNWEYIEIEKSIIKLDEVEYKLVIYNEDIIKIKW